MKANESTLATVDLGAFLSGSEKERRKIAQDVDQICRTVGFLIIAAHGVPANTIAAAWSTAREFFDLPAATKLRAKSPHRRCPRGYFPNEQESLAKTLGADTPPDRKEAFSIGPLSAPPGHTKTADFDFLYGPNIWPAQPERLRDDLVAYYAAMEKLGTQIMQLLATSLQLDANFFASYHTHHISALRVLNYPEMAAKSLPGQKRAGAHSDYGSVTILKPDPDIGGLEIRLPTGTWLEAPLLEDAFIVNLGDLMARWTNDRWVSTLHRVNEPLAEKGHASPRRQSIAYFMNPNYDAEILALPNCVADGSSPKYAPVGAGRYLIDKFNASI